MFHDCIVPSINQRVASQLKLSLPVVLSLFLSFSLLLSPPCSRTKRSGKRARSPSIHSRLAKRKEERERSLHYAARREFLSLVKNPAQCRQINIRRIVLSSRRIISGRLLQYYEYIVAYQSRVTRARLLPTTCTSTSFFYIPIFPYLPTFYLFLILVASSGSSTRLLVAPVCQQLHDHSIRY